MTGPRYGGANGVLEPASGDEVRGLNVVTGETASDPDTDAVLQWLHDTLAEAGVTPVVDVLPGAYPFRNEVTLTAKGTQIRGPNQWHSHQQPVLFWAPNGEWDSGDSMLAFGNTDDKGGRKGLVDGLAIKVNAAPCGVLSRGASGLTVRNVKAYSPPADGFTLDMAGGSNITWEKVNAEQVAVHNARNSKHETNSFTATDVFVKSAGSTDVPAMQINGDGWTFNHVVVNAIDNADLTVPMIAPYPEPGSNILEIRWIGGFIVGVAPVLVDGPTRCTFGNVRFIGGTETAVRNPRRTTIQNCQFNGNGRAVKTTDGIGRVVVSNNRFHGTGDSAYDGLIELTEGNGYWGWVVTNNQFGKVDTAYDIVLGYRKGEAVVSGNNLYRGIDERMPNTDSKDNVVVENLGYNPVLDGHEEPDIPDRTGWTAENAFGQGALVYHDGTGPFVRDSDGSRTAYPSTTDASPTYVPKNGEIGFESALPTEWLWLWQ